MTRSARLAIGTLVLAVLTLTAACTGPSAKPSDAFVEIDLYSGRENPTSPLTWKASQDLLAFINSHAPDAEPAAEPMAALGFRGLVVTPIDTDNNSSHIRIVPTAVYVTDGDVTQRIADESGEAFYLVWDDVRAHLEPAVVNAVEAAR